MALAGFPGALAGSKGAGTLTVFLGALAGFRMDLTSFLGALAGFLGALAGLEGALNLPNASLKRLTGFVPIDSVFVFGFFVFVFAFVFVDVDVLGICDPGVFDAFCLGHVLTFLSVVCDNFGGCGLDFGGSCTFIFRLLCFVFVDVIETLNQLRNYDSHGYPLTLSQSIITELGPLHRFC